MSWLRCFTIACCLIQAVSAAGKRPLKRADLSWALRSDTCHRSGGTCFSPSEICCPGLTCGEFGCVAIPGTENVTTHSERREGDTSTWVRLVEFVIPDIGNFADWCAPWAGVCEGDFLCCAGLTCGRYDGGLNVCFREKPEGSTTGKGSQADMSKGSYLLPQADMRWGLKSEMCHKLFGTCKLIRTGIILSSTCCEGYLCTVGYVCLFGSSVNTTEPASSARRRKRDEPPKRVIKHFQPGMGLVLKSCNPWGGICEPDFACCHGLRCGSYGDMKVCFRPPPAITPPTTTRPRFYIVYPSLRSVLYHMFDGYTW